ncbi:SDR family NAD(P)-dependent oxidoreductase [Candidatus Dojkabacteria bacterium]|uniref:SDR family NAD(P)-dependent oxidoreductase n=1 Tax=Candidatus Dojkabacteria bacterium TaxID=2099670 RepID=A0A955I900_9BACT|nr:SDR family NAD(P)-dependent oxidoreductase [Candidatus Dojkabacteria bacterium]
MSTILITGTSRGIGLATAQKFLDSGWKVIGTSTSGNCAVVSDEDFECYQLDVTNEEQIAHLIQDLQKRNIKLDAVVNNAGILLEEFDDKTLSIENLRKTVDVNLFGTVSLTEKLLADDLINSGGNIVMLSSQMSSLSNFSGSDCPAYRISKCALNMYVRTLAGRLADSNITVLAVDPGWVKTDMGTSEAPRQATEPAAEIYTLVNADIETGKFWQEGKEREW